MESLAHLQLKRLAVAYLLREGFVAAAREVRTPILRYRADVAGYIDRLPAPATDHLAADRLAQHALPFDAAAAGGSRSHRPACEPRTVIIECKRDRADFLRERHDLDELLAERARLAEQARRVQETVVKPAEPHLRRTDSSLFPELEAWDFHASTSTALRAVTRRSQAVERKIHGCAKLATLARYRLADRLLVLAPRGLIHPRELPGRWGLIECPARWVTFSRTPIEELAHTELRLARPAPDLHTRETHRARLLRNIAAAATRDAAR